jgi:hypothetical protein
VITNPTTTAPVTPAPTKTRRHTRLE